MTHTIDTHFFCQSIWWLSSIGVPLKRSGNLGVLRNDPGEFASQVHELQNQAAEIEVDRCAQVQICRGQKVQRRRSEGGEIKRRSRSRRGARALRGAEM